MKFVGIIPSRYASTRFPGKPLALVKGKPMIQCVYEQAKQALEDVVVATDDSRIFDCVRSFGGEVVMTSEKHTCGTERCLEALQIYLQQHNDSRPIATIQDLVVINIQGDEPYIQPQQIEQIKQCFPTEIATLVRPFTQENTLEDLQNPNFPKVLLRKIHNNIADVITFSRSVIPYLRGVEQEKWLATHTFYKHIGMYAYRADILQDIVQLPSSVLEKAESLEQMRWIEAGYAIKTAITEIPSYSVDTPEDLEYINQLNV